MDTSFNEEGDVLIDGLPVGTPFNFFLGLMFTIIFQFVGFLLMFFLSLSHASRNGAQVCSF